MLAGVGSIETQLSPAGEENYRKPSWILCKKWDSYEVTVNIDDSGKVVIAGSSAETTGSDDEELCACPKCDQGTIRIGEATYACDNAECTFRGLGRNVCKRDISVDEAKKILTEGKSDLNRGFHIEERKNFPAFLVLEANKVGFEFPPRAPPADAKKFPW